MRCRVVRSHVRSFETTPRVAAGGRVAFLRDDPANPGWFFGRAGSVEGYFPEAWFAIARDRLAATALRDYDAMELTVTAGERVHVLDEVGGWRLVRARDDATGWVPAEILVPCD
jgi:hypothetical protein